MFGTSGARVVFPIGDEAKAAAVASAYPEQVTQTEKLEFGINDTKLMIAQIQDWLPMVKLSIRTRNCKRSNLVTGKVCLIKWPVWRETAYECVLTRDAVRMVAKCSLLR